MLVSAVQRNRADELLHGATGVSMDTHSDLLSTAASNSSAALAQTGNSETASTWTPQEPFLGMTDESNNNPLSDDISVEMDWQAWDEIARDLDPSLEFWDMGGF